MMSDEKLARAELRAKIDGAKARLSAGRAEISRMLSEPAGDVEDDLQRDVDVARMRLSLAMAKLDLHKLRNPTDVEEPADVPPVLDTI